MFLLHSFWLSVYVDLAPMRLPLHKYAHTHEPRHHPPHLGVSVTYSSTYMPQSICVQFADGTKNMECACDVTWCAVHVVFYCYYSEVFSGVYAHHTLRAFFHFDFIVLKPNERTVKFGKNLQTGIGLQGNTWYSHKHRGLLVSTVFFFLISPYNILLPFFLQTHADVSGVPLKVTKEREACLLGSAILGAVGAGLFPDIPSAARAMVHVERTVVSWASIAVVRTFDTSKFNFGCGSDVVSG